MSADEAKATGRRNGMLLVLLISIIAMIHEARAGDPVLIPIEPPPLMVQTDGRLSWQMPAVTVYHNPRGSPLSDFEADGVITYALWSWSQRTGLQLDYGGLTELDRIDGAIVIRWATIMEMFEQRGSFFVTGYAQLWHYPLRSMMVASTVTIQSMDWSGGIGNSRLGAQTLMHELGHALGIVGHSEDRNAVMFFSRVNNRYALTPMDVKLTQYRHQVCHSELTPHGDVYIPGIIGYGVTLRAEGGRLHIIHEHHTGLYCSGSVDGDTATIYDVRGFGEGYTNVRLRLTEEGMEVVDYEQ